MQSHKSFSLIPGKIVNSKIFSASLSFIRNIKSDGQKTRMYIQFGFLLLIMWIGYEFYGFVQYHQTDWKTQYFSRPPGVEGFLPISALLSLKYWLITGIINDIHPSGMILLIIIIAVSFLLKKSFCAWICPVGLMSESLWQLGIKLFKKNIRLWKWLDFPLRSLKYILLFFFIYAVFWEMDVLSLKQFIYSPYNKVADIKMLMFFTDMSSVTLWTLIILVILSVVIKNFWCRYLCPYGAFLGFLSIFSPVKVTRNEETCTNCQKCTKACPHLIPVHTLERVSSDECTGCSLCLVVCPEEDTLDFKVTKKSKAIPTWAFGLSVVLIFLMGTALARITGHWQNKISDQEYRKRVQEIDKPIYNHNRGKVPAYDEND